jgi:hypothetical protein
MARIADELPPGELAVPVLSSPRLGMQRVAALVARPSVPGAA